MAFSPVEPVALIDPLSDNLDGRLGAILLHHGHVEIIHEDTHLFTNGRAIKVTPPSETRSITGG